MSLTANAQGQITGRFTIPAKIPVGSKLVEFIGTASTARATFVGRGVVSIEELQTITVNAPVGTLVWQGDPLAQTFTLPRAQLVSGVELWFSAKGSSRVAVQLRRCQAGMPTREVITDAVLPPASISLTGPTRFSWAPVRLEADTEYAFVVLCDDAVTACKLAELGKFDSVNQKWVTSQAYQVGVLLSSSNGGTWTAHQTMDLTFRLLTPSFAATTRTVTLPAVTVTAADQLLVLAAVERPMEGVDVVFELTVPGGKKYTVRENQPLLLPAPITGSITWKAILSGTANASPRLSRDVQLVWGKSLQSCDYITRAMPATGGSKVRVQLTALTPGASDAAVSMQVVGSSTWTVLPLASATPVGDNWEERAYELTPISAEAIQVKLVLTGTAQSAPRVRNLHVIVT